MTWLFFALLAPFLFALTNQIDKILLSRYFTQVKATTLLIYTVIVSIFISIGIVLFKPSVLNVSLPDAGLMFAAGIIFYFAIAPFIKALSIEEASRVIPIFQIQPVLAYIFGIVLFAEALSVLQILAGLIIVAGALLINLDLDNRRRFKASVFGLVLLSCLFYMLESSAFKFVGGNYGFWDAAFYQYLGTAVAGLTVFMTSRSYRVDFKKVSKEGGAKVIVGAMLSAILSMGGRMAFNYSLLLAPLVMVQLIQGTQAIFVLLIGTLLAIFIPKYGKENISSRHMTQKIVSIVVVCIGTALLLLG
ncbi:EamA family transporter [Candidatus Saccharibacteria bacterium]|nr:EamA family transporter [Candidatus Saccharibacteria bacterium]